MTSWKGSVRQRVSSEATAWVSTSGTSSSAGASMGIAPRRAINSPKCAPVRVSRIATTLDFMSMQPLSGSPDGKYLIIPVYTHVERPVGPMRSQIDRTGKSQSTTADQPGGDIDREPENRRVEEKRHERVRDHNLADVPIRRRYIGGLAGRCDGEGEIGEVPKYWRRG